MLGILSSILGFIIAIGILTAVHEFGHFWVARRCGVKVTRFAIGFGKPLISWYDKLGTEYVIAAIPFGGYVLMLGETEDEIVSQQEQHMAFNRKPVFCKLAIICAGPLANMMFAVAIYWLIFMLGVTTLVPILGTVPKGSIADIANLQQGYEVVGVNNQTTSSWEDIAVALMPYVGGKEFVKIKAYERADNIYSEHVLNLTGWSVDNKDGDVLKSLGLAPFDPIPAIIGKLLPGNPAEKAGVLPGDTVIQADKNKITNRTQLTNYLHGKYNTNVTLTVVRDNGSKRDITLVPIKKLIEGGEEVGFIGVQFQAGVIPKEYLRTQRSNPLIAFNKALVRTKSYTLLTVQFLQKIFVGKMSLGHISGPISIAKYAGESVRAGIDNFLGFLALVSISLGVLNMLPIPVLDGGHFVFCAIELFTGKPISQRALTIARFIGIALLVCLMGLALHNDILRF